ncbi:hypothetical protein ACTID9_04400 [Brevibacillus fluminis]|uniref:hypothetical protein n=1 Tax=Brevibacillus fluminis TaxID=511487 RepID=UPI003F8B2142
MYDWETAGDASEQPNGRPANDQEAASKEEAITRFINQTKPELLYLWPKAKAGEGAGEAPLLVYQPKRK